MSVVALPSVQVGADPDAALVGAMAEGDTDALRTLYARHGRDLQAYLIARLSDRRLAEEVLQDVMLAAWHGASDFRGDGKVRTWLLAIAHNRGVNALRRRSVSAAPIEPEQVDRRNPSPDRFERSDDVTDLRAALCQLPDHQREALQLVFFHGLTTAEAAQVMGVPQGTVKSRIHRAEAAIRRHMSMEGPSDV